MTTTNLQDWIDENCPSYKYKASYRQFQDLVAHGFISHAMRHGDEAIMYELLSKYTEFLSQALEANDLNKDFVETQIKYTLDRVMRERLNYQSRVDQLQVEADKQKHEFLTRLLKVV